MRRLAPALAIPLVLLVALPARAQQSSPSPAVTLRLVDQTRWNDPDHTLVKVVLRAANHSDQTLDSLSIFLGINTATTSRTQYEQSLQGTTGSEQLGNTFVETGSLAPGQRATYAVRQDVTTLANIGTGVYPMTVELRSHDVPIPGAVIRSPVIFLSKNPPLQPLDLSWSFVLSAPITYEPDGFHSPYLQRELSLGRPLRDELDALATTVSARGAPSFDVAVAPQLLDQLLAMSRGYTLRVDGSTHHIARGTGGSAAADHALFDIRSIVAAPSSQASALPFASPSIPALIAAGLVQDLPQQLARGQQDFSSIFRRDPSAGILHPPESRLDQASVYALQQNSVRLLLIDSSAVRQPEQENGYAKPPVVALPSGTPTPMRALVPDGGVQAILTGPLPREDPRLAVQVVLGELAQIWLEAPSVSRGIAMSISERTNLTGDFIRPFLRSVGTAPWLHPMKASSFAAAHPPESGVTASVRPAAAGPTFSPGYLTALQQARQNIATYTSILARSDPTTTDGLERLILLAESGDFIGNEDMGRSFLGSVTERLTKEFAAVTPDTSSVVTLTSRHGTIPVPIHNLTGRTVKVRVELQAGGRLTVDDNARLITVPPDGTTQLFVVPAQGQLVVRSTAYNLIALIITIGAALFLLAWWGRRFLPRVRAGAAGAGAGK